MDNDKDREIRDEFIEYLEQSSERRIQELNQLYEKRIENQERLYQTIIDEKQEKIKILERQIADLIQQRNEKENQRIQNINLQGAIIRGGFAGRDYTGDVINQIQQLLEDKSQLQVLLQQNKIDKEIFKTLLQQLIDKLEQDND